MSAKIIPLRREERPTAHDLIVTLVGITPPIWRRIRVSSALTLRDLHHVLQIAFGWNDSHLHEFEIGALRYGLVGLDEDADDALLDERVFTLGEVSQAGDRFEYVYDFGDDWRHEVAVQDTPPSKPRASKVTVLEGARSGPPDDAGGPLRYLHMLEVLRKPRHREHAAIAQWIGPGFSPEKFDAKALNRALRGAGTAAFRRRRERLYEER